MIRDFLDHGSFSLCRWFLVLNHELVKNVLMSTIAACRPAIFIPLVPAAIVCGVGTFIRNEAGNFAAN
jgi:hypothetical protein